MERNESPEMKLTAEEAKQVEKAFEDASFRKLLAEYVSELSDPSHREEHEAYIKQLEDQNELPFGKALIRPKAGFVVKCMQTKTREKSNGKCKLFLNVVYSEEVSKPLPTSESSKAWSVPFALGPLRMEADKSGDLIPTFDCCFHPLSLEYAHGSKSFCNMIVDIAKDAIQKSFQASGDDICIDQGYKILKGVMYKSGTAPKAMMIASDSANHSSNGPSKDASKSVAKATPIPDKGNINAPKGSSNVIVPKYKIVERGHFEISDHTTMTTKPLLRRPNELVVYVTLEHIESVVDINLDVSQRSLVVTSLKESKCQYQLEASLPYPVDSKKGSARFDKKQKKLIVTLPVISA
jgi:dynein assembly factor 2